MIVETVLPLFLEINCLQIAGVIVRSGVRIMIDDPRCRLSWNRCVYLRAREMDAICVFYLHNVGPAPTICANQMSIII